MVKREEIENLPIGQKIRFKTTKSNHLFQGEIVGMEANDNPLHKFYSVDVKGYGICNIYIYQIIPVYDEDKISYFQIVETCYSPKDEEEVFNKLYSSFK